MVWRIQRLWRPPPDADRAEAGGGLGKGGKVPLYTDGKKVGEGQIPVTLAMVFAAADGLDVCEDSDAPVSLDYGSADKSFNGTVEGTLLSIAEDRSEHLIDPAQAIRVALPWQ